MHTYVITPFEVVLLVYPLDSPRADNPQHHEKRCNKMFITLDWSLLGNYVRKWHIHPNKAIHVNLRITCRSILRS